MKYTLSLVVAVFVFITASSQQNKIVLVVNGAELTDELITLEQLAHFCQMEIKYSLTGEVHQVSSFKYVISSAGSIYKRECPGTKMLPENLKKGDVIFIEELKLDKEERELIGQFALTLK